MNEEVKSLWIAALLSGGYEQGRFALRTTEHGTDQYCCLGVLCDVAAISGEGRWREAPRGACEFFAGAQRRSGVLPDAIRSWAGISVARQGDLTRLNDREAASFETIAAWIDENL